MSHRSLINCKTEEQRIRLNLKRCVKSLRRYWLLYLNARSAKRVDTYWAKCLRRLIVLEQIGKSLQKTPEGADRVDFVGKIMKRYVKKIAKYAHIHEHLSASFGLKTKWDDVKTGSYHRTITSFMKYGH